MDIQQFYKKTASISLNASLASLVPPFFLIMYGIIIAPDGKLVLAVVPFLLYSFICYQYYLVNDQRSKEIKEILPMADKNPSELLMNTTVLFTFLPAPTLRMLIFGNE